MKNTSNFNELSWQDLEPVEPTPSLNLPDITEKSCHMPKDGSPYYVFRCEARGRYNGGCPCCGSIDYRYHGSLKEPRLIHDVSIGLKQIDILLEENRYLCKDCGATFTHPFESVLENRQMTKRLLEQIRHEAFSHTFLEVANKYGYSDTMVANIFDEYVAELEAARPVIIAPRVLGIDEKHISNSMRGVFLDVETGEILEMTEDNKAATVQAVIEGMIEYDTKIEIVTMDMANGYRSTIEMCLPNAKIVVDKYHVLQDMSRKVRTSKTAIIKYINNQLDKEMPSADRQQKKDILRLLANNAYLFLFGAEKLEEKESRLALMADVCSHFPELNHLRLLKEGFERIYEASNRAEAEQRYEEWVVLVPPRGSKQVVEWQECYQVDPELFKDFKSLKNTMERWKSYVFNYFDENCRVTNAIVEGTNSLITRLNNIGSGYSFPRLRAKVLYRKQAGTVIRYSARKLRREIPSFGFAFGNRTHASYEMTWEVFREEMPWSDEMD